MTTLRSTGGFGPRSPDAPDAGRSDRPAVAGQGWGGGLLGAVLLGEPDHLRGQAAGDDVGDGHPLQYRAEAAADGHPDLLERLHRPGVAEFPDSRLVDICQGPVDGAHD